MSRQDIADYLGLTIETISRTMTLLENEAAIELPNARKVVMRSKGRLQALNAGAAGGRRSAMYKTIIVHVDADDPGSANRVTLATGLAADCHAALIGVAAAVPPLTVSLLATDSDHITAGCML